MGPVFILTVPFSLLAPFARHEMGELLQGEAIAESEPDIAVQERAPIRKATDSPLSMQLELLTEEGAICLGEALIARVRIKNVSNAPCKVIGFERDFFFFLYASDGKLASRPPPERLHVGGLAGVHTLQPGEERTSLHLLEPWFRLAEEGTFSVQARLFEHSDEVRSLATAEAPMQVVALDAKHLEARCQALFEMSRMPSREWDQGIPHLALLRVRHDVVLPYLDSFAQQGDLEACIAIRRVGTRRAQKLIEALAERDDRVGEAARKAMAMELGDDTLPYPPDTYAGVRD